MANTKVLLATSKGDMTLELDETKAPGTSANFIEYVKSGFYDGTIFHRVIPGFVVQGGGMLPGMTEKDTRDPIRNEATNGLSNARGTISMARTSDPHSASSQFFLNLVDNARLDHRSPTPSGWGYCVFGRITEGLDVLDAIAAVPTGSRPPHDDVPKEDVVLIKASIA
jgi:cyclophilin family peptidyl-prolyl cis-trans isomerase